MEPYRFKPHSLKQEAIIFSDYDLTIACTGTQFGKSMAGGLWVKRQIHKWWHDPRANHLLLAPTYKTMHQSMLPYFLSYMRGLGEYKSSFSQFNLHNGGVVYMRTGTDANSVVGIPNVRSYWLDEAGLGTLYFWENIKARAASVGAMGLLTTSPYARNWLYRDYVKKRKYLTDVNFIEAASWENPYHSFYDPIKREAAREQMDPRRFEMIFGGMWGQMAGLVYDCFSEDENTIDPFEIPLSAKVVAGIDWGTTDPFVLLVRAILPDGRHIQISEYFKTGLTLFDMIQIAKQKQRIYNIERFYCGQDQPGYIEEFNRNRLPCEAVDNDIRLGIDLHYELIKTRRFQIFKNTSPNCLDEYETYHYPEPKDLKPDQDSKDELPVGQNDHCCDAARYCTIATYRTRLTRKDVINPILQGEHVEIKLPVPNNAKRLKQLMVPSSRRGHTERFE